MYLQAKEWTAILGKTKKEKPTEKFYSESEEEEDESASTSATGKQLETDFHIWFLNSFYLQNWQLIKMNQREKKVKKKKTKQRCI